MTFLFTYSLNLSTSMGKPFLRASIKLTNKEENCGKFSTPWQAVTRSSVKPVRENKA